MQPTRVVLADDHPALAAACQRLLAPVCDVVAVVASGPEALAAVHEHDPEILVLDVTMPGLGGIQVAERLERETWAGRIVVLTLHRDPALAKRAFAHGVLGYVTKARMARDLLPAVAAAREGERFCSPLADEG